MVLQHRAFCLTESDVIEIPLQACNPQMNENHVVVDELAFGPDSDASVRGVALYFNIPESEMTVFTPAQAKRFRWKRSVKKDNDRDEKYKKASAFDAMDSFEMIRPHDTDAFELATTIMMNRLDILQAERISSMRQRHDALRALEVRKQALQQRFEALKRHWTSWAWPVNAGRKKVDKNTPVPKVEGPYEFRKGRLAADNGGNDGESNDEDDGLGSATKNVWTSFVKTEFDANAMVCQEPIDLA